MIVSDALQVWLDIANHPSRGEEQADLIYEKAPRPIVANENQMNDLDALAKLAQALSPWRTQLLYIGDGLIEPLDSTRGIQSVLFGFSRGRKQQTHER